MYQSYTAMLFIQAASNIRKYVVTLKNIFKKKIQINIITPHSKSCSLPCMDKTIIQCSPLKVNSLGPEKSVHFIQGSL